MGVYGLYFRSPFPKAEGFSAYRMPGLLVHIPVLIAFLVVGGWACLQAGWLMPFILVYAIVGVYWGRDLAILAHYNGLITLVVLAGLVFGLPNIGALPRPGPAASVLITAAVAALFILYVRWRMRAETQDTPQLHWIVQKLDAAAIAKALDAGADVNEKDQAIGWGYTPLHLASALVEQADAARVVPVLELLVARGADIHARSSRQETPLHIAVDKGSEPLVRKLLELGADPNVTAQAGVTPLFLAVRKGNRAIIETLLAAKADMNARAHDMSPLAEAARQPDFDLVAWLMEKGARQDDESALRLLAGSADPRALELMTRLIDAGARPSDDMLVRAPTAAMVRFLGAHGARADRLPPGKSPATTYAAPEERLERLEALRELGCNVAAADSSGHTLLHAIAGSPDELARLEQMLPRLLGWGIDINARDEQGKTALHRLVELSDAIYAPKADVMAGWIRVFRDAGADPRIANGKGEDCLALAKRLKAPRAVKKALAAP